MNLGICESVYVYVCVCIFCAVCVYSMCKCLYDCAYVSEYVYVMFVYRVCVCLCMCVSWCDNELVYVRLSVYVYYVCFIYVRYWRIFLL